MYLCLYDGIDKGRMEVVQECNRSKDNPSQDFTALSVGGVDRNVRVHEIASLERSVNYASEFLFRMYKKSFSCFGVDPSFLFRWSRYGCIGLSYFIVSLFSCSNF